MMRTILSALTAVLAPLAATPDRPVVRAELVCLTYRVGAYVPTSGLVSSQPDDPVCVNSPVPTNLTEAGAEYPGVGYAYVGFTHP